MRLRESGVSDNTQSSGKTVSLSDLVKMQPPWMTTELADKTVGPFPCSGDFLESPIGDP